MTDRPIVDEDSAVFWGSVRRHVIALQRCSACGRLRFPPMPTCPYCAGRTAVLEEVSGRGTLYSWIRVENPLDPSFASDVPYVIGVVALEEGPRLAARIEGDPVFDGPVAAVFVDHPDWTELRFAPASPS